MKLISPTYINVKGRLLDLATPQVMGILNVTPDSFLFRQPDADAGGNCSEGTADHR